MGYDLNGKRLLLSFNVIKYPGFKRDRNGSENDERNIINTFKVNTLESLLEAKSSCRI